MYRHASTCLKGPVSRSRAWWQEVTDEEREGREDDSTPKTVCDDRPAAMRLDLIARVRKEIANGTYDTPDKWEAALGCLLDRESRT